MTKFISYRNLQRFMAWIDTALINLQNDYSEKIEEKSAVSGTHDGTNWETLTVDGVTKGIPQLGEGGKLSVRGVRISAQNTSVTAKTWTIPTQSYVDGDQSMFDSTDNAFVAPCDGIYSVTAMITDTIYSMEAMVAVFKENIDNHNTIAASYKSATTISGIPPIASATVRLNRGDKLYCAIISNKGFSIQPINGFYSEFYLLGG